ncbi:MAG: hypothetical protein Q8N23_36115 [Archangium sp.]|nr:hypothetical protein [Archangium sp.]MDP3158154.1 hypothetical protein [Archangium sp.]MDP3571707.1 hypothetical protein [Archangium sp.]
MMESLTTQAAAQLVPASYAEKAMASLMQLHSELMDEKERRVELFRKLMEREQSLAELKMYVKMLEEKVSARPMVTTPAEPQPTPQPPRQVRTAPVPPRIPSAPRTRLDGWKTW